MREIALVSMTSISHGEVRPTKEGVAVRLDTPIPPLSVLGHNEQATSAQLQRSRDIDPDQLPLINIQPFSDQLLIADPPVRLKDHQTRLSVTEDQVYRQWISDNLQ
eukprot:Blabericola_migrator_1__4931@NODE_2572_length_2587_cov_150_202778_g1610_i0_p2_GENE_NODE_2572_length_2587_cov_150_202778_g1610_i0NODE_2572_length_2587_cov_150_202778_g1610_i0_p2_ORF_typecomplete_len106_score11_54_NODE_2572_length_2587_cov_150_202778_g1610_i0264581